MFSGKEGEKSLRIVFVTVLTVFVFPIICSFFMTMPLGLVLFYFTVDGIAAGTQFSINPPIQLFMFYRFHLPLTFHAGEIFLFLWVLFIICFIAALRLRKSLSQAISKGISQSVHRLFDNNLFTMPIISSMLLISIIGIHIFQESVAGVPTGDIPVEPNPFLTFFELTYASFLEELSFRVSSIGFFLILYLIVVGRDRIARLSFGKKLKLVLVTPLCPEKAKRLVGLRTVNDYGIKAISIYEWILIAVTAVFFGVAHYLSGIGWGPGKITTATLDGLVFGLMYLMYGAQAPFLLHWFRNYYLWFFNTDLALEHYPSIYPLFLILELGILVLGFVGFSVLTAIGADRVLRNRRRRKHADM